MPATEENHEIRKSEWSLSQSRFEAESFQKLKELLTTSVP
jgi:hypothetical protein